MLLTLRALLNRSSFGLLVVVAIGCVGGVNVEGAIAQQSPPPSEMTQNANSEPFESFTFSGRVDQNSAIWFDGSFHYNRHPFEGVAGQAIVVEADDTFPYFMLETPSGNMIYLGTDNPGASSGTSGFEKPSMIATLSETGTYAIFVPGPNSPNPREVTYTITVRAATPADIRLAEADRLYFQANTEYAWNHNYEEALRLFNQALEIYHELGNVRKEIDALQYVSRIYTGLSRYEQAINSYHRLLSIYRALNPPGQEAGILADLANIYDLLNDPQQASAYREQVNDIVMSSNLYTDSLADLQESLSTCQASNDRECEARNLISLGLIYTGSEPLLQIDLYQQALSIYEELNEHEWRFNVLMMLGQASMKLDRYETALEYYNQALSVRQELQQAPPTSGEEAFRRESITGFNSSLFLVIGDAYSRLNRYQQAVTYYEQAVSNYYGLLAAYGAASDTNSSYFYLNPILIALGNAYDQLNQYEQAIDSYQQALAITQAKGDREGEGKISVIIGNILVKQDQPELAIAFYKQSVNIRESIRADIRGLDRTLQQSYTDSVSADYRALADLLLSQGRILEAQQVLDLLKLEELREFTRDARSIGSGNGIALNATEQQILEEHGSIVAFGQKLAECEQTNCPEEDQLRSQQRDLNAAYRDRMETLINIIRDNRRNDDFFNDPRNLSENALAIVNAQPGTVLIYPFVQDDKLWLLWTTTGGVVGSKAIEVTQAELGETVVRFRQLLESPRSDLAELQATSKQLYDWLIAPLRQELEAQNQSIEHLVFAQDRILRYLPMAALYDGEQYLIERYTVSTILSADLTNMSDRLAPTTADNPLLALGLSDSVDGLAPLPNVSIELDEIVRTASTDPAGIYPGQEYLNENFTLAAIENNLRDSRILHIATHGNFVPGLPDQSYLVLGDGQKLTGSEIDRLGYDLQNINLVVLSACETALGGPGSDGIEIAGISSYFLDANRASTVLASLWQVNDVSTSALMQQFYANLANGMTKAEALRQAQLSRLSSGSEASGENRTGNGSVTAIDRTTGQPRSLDNPSHPYFWSPFILIGSGL